MLGMILLGKQFEILKLTYPYRMWAWITLCIVELVGAIWFWKFWKRTQSIEKDKNARIISLELLKNSLEERLNLEEERLASKQLFVGQLHQEVITLKQDLEQQEVEISNLIRELNVSREETKHQKGRAASQATSKGQALEKWAPFIDHPSIDPSWKIENWSFLGSPIDYIVWHHFPSVEENLAEGKVVFLDIKAGKSGLTTKQRRIRDLIRAGRVEWRTVKLE